MDTSAYPGHVEPRGEPIHRTIDHGASTVRLTKLSVGPMDNNCYILADVDAGEALVIDAADDPQRILDAVGDLRVTVVLTTHGHQDHWQALDAVARTTGATVVHHAADRARIPRAPDHTVEHGTWLTFGRTRVEVRHTPGHTDGSICVLLTGHAADRPQSATHLFSGDTLFPGGPGKTQGAEQFDQIMRSLREHLFVLPDDTWVYPGHGDDTTLGHERGRLDQWQARGW
ncbi:MAG TPA: MBL fold metallo-hydrolase [Euzebyales bacterium]|nr:MBL fold metallo-hydrolase [Euzebyales bacterium]